MQSLNKICPWKVNSAPAMYVLKPKSTFNEQYWLFLVVLVFFPPPSCCSKLPKYFLQKITKPPLSAPTVFLTAISYKPRPCLFPYNLNGIWFWFHIFLITCHDKVFSFTLKSTILLINLKIIWFAITRSLTSPLASPTSISWLTSPLRHASDQG